MNISKPVPYYNPQSVLRQTFKDYLEMPVWVACKLKWVEQNGKPKLKKIPVDVRTGHNARSNDPVTWADFNKVDAYCSSHEGHLPAVGLSTSLGLVCVDLDDVLREGDIRHDVQPIINSLDSYTERSASGAGLHIFVKAKKPGARCKQAGGLEIYDHNHFIAVTGEVLSGYSNIEERQEAIDILYGYTFSVDKADQTSWQRSPSMADEEVIVKCRGAKNSDKFASLYDAGDLRDYGDDASSADLALMGIFAFYTQDETQLERLFSSSALCQRDKWPQREDYRKRTIGQALQGLSATYQFSKSKEEIVLWEASIEQEPFPTEMLPPILRRAVMTVSEVTQVPPQLPATIAQAMTCVAIGTKIKVLEKSSPKLLQQLSTMYTVVGHSGSARKSVTSDPFLRIFKEYHKVRKEAYKQLMREYENAKAGAKARKEKLKRALGDNPNWQGYTQECAKIDGIVESKKPKYYRLYTTDATVAAYAKGLSETDGCFSLISTDAGDIIDYIIGTPQSGSNDIIFVKVNTGDEIHVDRVGPDRRGVSLDIPSPCGTVFLMTQEERWGRFSKEPRLRASGLHGRNNICIVPPRLKGYIESEVEPVFDEEALGNWDNVMNTLLEFSEEITLKLGKEAAVLRRELNNRLQATVGLGKENDDVIDIISRAVTETVKRSAVFHVINHIENLAKIPKEIPPATFMCAEAVQMWYLQQAINSRRESTGQLRAYELQHFIESWHKKYQAKKVERCMSPRKIKQYILKNKTVAEIKDLCCLAAEYGLVTIVPGPRDVDHYRLEPEIAARLKPLPGGKL